MPLFRRRQKPHGDDGEAAAIDAFWTWWQATGATETARAVADREPQRVVNDISTHVRGMRAGLAWELGPGATSAHLLVISPEGNPELRAVARRWLRAAPPPSAEWEYADARQPSSNLDDLTLDVGGRTVALGEIIVQTQPAGSRLGVVMHHDVLSPLAEQDRQQIAFLALDNAVGEDVVETWLGTIEVSTEPPDQGVPLGKLADLVAAHRAAHLNEDGSPTWQLLQGDGPKGPLLALALVPLYPTIAAQHDNHVMVTVPYVDRTDHGFPSEPALEALRSFEDHLSNRLGGSGTLVASETSAGVRTLHYYVDSTSSGAEVVAGAVTGWPDGTVRVVTAHDPGWQAVRHLA